jgi:hypothetical protein
MMLCDALWQRILDNWLADSDYEAFTRCCWSFKNSTKTSNEAKQFTDHSYTDLKEFQLMPPGTKKSPQNDLAAVLQCLWQLNELVCWHKEPPNEDQDVHAVGGL